MTELPVVSQTGATQTDEKTFEVTGDLTPDVTGTYEDAGEYNGKRYYQRTPNGWFIWWDGVEFWDISQAPGSIMPISWFHNFPDIEGLYSPGAGASGNATVAEI